MLHSSILQLCPALNAILSVNMRFMYLNCMCYLNYTVLTKNELNVMHVSQSCVNEMSYNGIVYELFDFI